MTAEQRYDRQFANDGAITPEIFRRLYELVFGFFDNRQSPPYGIENIE